MALLRARQMLGKYRIDRRLGDGGFGSVYAATDTIEGLRVALKIPHATNIDKGVLDSLLQEVRIAVSLEHAGILSPRFAGFYEGHFIICFPLGEETLHDRLARRMSLTKGLDLAEQMLQAVAFAHRQKVLHCDIKPENFILFPDNRIRLADFGIARVARINVSGHGTGTLGYMAPEQAMGSPSFRSDVFSLGLILCRMFSGQWPTYPFEWPPPGHARLRQKLHPNLIAVIRRSIDLNPRKRFRDADQMLRAFGPASRLTLNRHAQRQS